MNRPTPNPPAEPATERLPPHKVLKDYYGEEQARRPYIDHLFDVSARHYDWITGMMSFGSGRWYRRQALLRAGLEKDMRLLDVGCGTGVITGLAQEIVGPGGEVVALDPSMGMLREARARHHARAVQAVGERLPFPDGYFDRLSMGYALRHVADLREAFAEYRRVLRPGGQLLLLEITRPASKVAYYPLKGYLKYVVPTLTRAVRRSRDAQELMSYYWETIEHCVPPARILAALDEAGLTGVERYVELGIFSEYRATR